MRAFFKKPETSPSLSTLIFRMSDTTPTTNENIESVPELVSDNSYSTKTKNASGLYKHQRIYKDNEKVTAGIKEITAKPSQALIAEKDKLLKDNKIFKRKTRKVVILLIKSLKRKEAIIEKFGEQSQEVAKKIKSLEEENSSFKKAIKLYQEELRAYKIREIELLKIPEFEAKALDLQSI